jgi:hypothetical protein
MYKISQWLLDLNLTISPMYISSNPHPGAIQFLKSNPEYINWDYISSNPMAMEWIHANPDKINNNMLNLNPNALDLLTPSNINWYWFCKNPSLFKCKFINEQMILDNMFKDQLVQNTSIEAYTFVLRHRVVFGAYGYYKLLANNPFAFKHSYHHERYLIHDLGMFNLCKNPEAMEYIISTPNQIDWTNLCENPAAISYIQSHTDKITPSIWKNPSIFELDYQAMSIQRTSILLEDLMMKTMHPSRIGYWLENGLKMDDL